MLIKDYLKNEEIDPYYSRHQTSDGNDDMAYGLFWLILATMGLACAWAAIELFKFLAAI